MTSLGRLGGLFLLGWLAGGCGGDETKSKLTRTEPTADGVELRADWSYESFQVDVSLTLITRVSPDSCVSSGALSVDEALSSKQHYDLPATPCDALELSAGGDIVVEGEVTGHDWADEPLSVDTDAKVISLGPVSTTDADGNAVTYRFTLSSSPCPDEPSCECGLLRRIANGENIDLQLSRRC
jgi:hypothetical protein